MHGLRSLQILKKAMTVFAVVAFFLFCGFLGGHALADNYNTCTDRKTTQVGLAKSGFAYVGTFITSDNIVTQLYIHRSGAWVIIGITDDMQACVLILGKEYALAVERES